MNFSDYLLFFVVAQLVWIIRAVSKQNSTIALLRRKCPILNGKRKEVNTEDGGSHKRETDSQTTS